MQMNQYTQYLMCVKSKDLIINSYNNHSTSWEEQAFPEDALGPLGGFLWPPRSYSCSFCKREFRSAQALGGHMNVHRRERARLKQSHTPPQDHTDPQSTLLESSEISNPSATFVVASSLSLSPSRISSPVRGGHEFSFLEGHGHDHDHDQSDVETNFFVDGLILDLSAGCVNRVDIDEEMEDIDLELRLGHASPKMK